MECSWSTVLNPLNLMRAFWNLAVHCWRRLEVFLARLMRDERAPTVENVVAFQNQPAESAEHRRHFSLQARHGSVDPSIQDSTLSDFSPVNEVFAFPETVSQTSRHSSGEKNEPGTERMPRSGQVCQDSPLLPRRERQRSQERTDSSFEGAPRQVSDPSERAYRTFST